MFPPWALQILKPTMDPLISLTIRDRNRVFQPGDELFYEFQVDAVDDGEVQAVEASVLWYTEGKGDEDLGVHSFNRLVPSSVDGGDLRQLQQLSTQLPNSPLSYDGVIVKVRWCVRVRVFFRGGKEIFFEEPFQLGDVPPVQQDPS